MRLLITPLAAQDLEEIGDFIAQDNPQRASSFISELRMQCKKICLNPAGYRLRPELTNNLRSCAHGNYVIFLKIHKIESPLFEYCMAQEIFPRHSIHFKTLSHPFARILKHTRPWRLFTPAIWMP